ncbi:hypothetical protein IT072_04295 [Leifsonia sp. ZF2019]|uniref:hypothetical protein n=1 Tax=Leifsonia sp. ZF2019 TaxID=2781978 RepID=UPI001CC04780|nr:hypothetical protein [Leifsonia sp. ZF2019]UAJ80275.1 hypothetical protein IT072_04295 [Leifsonia sp. ZF2019]
MSSTRDLAARLFAEAEAAGQAAHRVQPGDEVGEVRALVRRSARRRGVRIRTGLIEDTLVVVRADAALWDESSRTMREKLTPHD